MGPEQLGVGPFWSPNGKHLACSGDASIAIYDTETGKQIHAWTDESVRGQSSVGLIPRLFLAWHPDGRQLASVSSNDGTVKVWDALTGKELSSFDTGRPRQGFVYHWAVAWSPDGERLATAGGNELQRFGTEPAGGSCILSKHTVIGSWPSLSVLMVGTWRPGEVVLSR